jgi:hypothetical protein
MLTMGILNSSPFTPETNGLSDGSGKPEGEMLMRTRLLQSQLKCYLVYFGSYL